MKDLEVLKRIGLNIRKMRLEQGLNLTEFAYCCGMDKGNMYKIEYGKMNLTIKTLLKICEALKVRLVDVVNVE